MADMEKLEEDFRGLLEVAGHSCEDIQNDVLHYLAHIKTCDNCRKVYPKLAKLLDETVDA